MTLYPDEYENNAAFDLPQYIQDRILARLNSLCWHNSKQSQEERKYFISFLDSIGIYIGYNWIGHRGNYFFITPEDAENQIDWMEQCRD